MKDPFISYAGDADVSLEKSVQSEQQIIDRLKGVM